MTKRTCHSLNNIRKPNFWNCLAPVHRVSRATVHGVQPLTISELRPEQVVEFQGAIHGVAKKSFTHEINNDSVSGKPLPQAHQTMVNNPLEVELLMLFKFADSYSFVLGGKAAVNDFDKRLILFGVRKSFIQERFKWGVSLGYQKSWVSRSFDGEKYAESFWDSEYGLDSTVVVIGEERYSGIDVQFDVYHKNSLSWKPGLFYHWSMLSSDNSDPFEANLSHSWHQLGVALQWEGLVATELRVGYTCPRSGECIEGGVFSNLRVAL